MKIDWLTTGTQPTWIENNFLFGGRVYEGYLRKILRTRYELNIIYLSRGNSKQRVFRAGEFARYFLNNILIEFKSDLVIRDFFSTIFAPLNKKAKNVIIIHHLEFPRKHKTFYEVLKHIFFKKAQFVEKIVVVSEYWKNILEKNGCSNIRIIYNSFDISNFVFNENEIISFKNSLGIKGNSPLLYLGNARSEKGFIQTYRALKDIDAVLVATGKNKIDLPILCKYFSYHDYLKLLKISSLAIFMSTFKEGWCRSAHEAMLCGTPVIGSGAGGMRELLSKGEQIICDDFSKLRSTVINVLKDKQKLDDLSLKGRKFAEQFSLDYFEKSWISLIEEIM
jgi:glycosyltransferase involved in cell wall biosynthesis